MLCLVGTYTKNFDDKYYYTYASLSDLLKIKQKSTYIGLKIATYVLKFEHKIGIFK